MSVAGRAGLWPNTLTVDGMVDSAVPGVCEYSQMLSVLSDNFGTLLVALVSIVTVLATNRNAMRMRRMDAKDARVLEASKREASAADRLYEERRDALFGLQTQAVLARNELGLTNLLDAVANRPARKSYDYSPLDCASYRAQTYCSEEGAAAAEKLRTVLHVAPHVAAIEGTREIAGALEQWNKVILRELNISPPNASDESGSDDQPVSKVRSVWRSLRAR